MDLRFKITEERGLLIMKKQMIISVGREYGSYGHAIAERLAVIFDIPLYDNNLLCHIAEEKEMDHDSIKKFDGKPRNKFLHRKVSGYSSSPEENLAQMQFDYIRKMAEEGKSFVIVGRCAETKLRDFPALISIFILGRKEEKIKNVMKTLDLDEESAKQLMQREDWKKKTYHNYYCKGKWGDARNYDLTVDSGRLGVEGTVDFLADYIRRRMQ